MEIRKRCRRLLGGERDHFWGRQLDEDNIMITKELMYQYNDIFSFLFNIYGIKQ